VTVDPMVEHGLLDSRGYTWARADADCAGPACRQCGWVHAARYDDVYGPSSFLARSWDKSTGPDVMS